MYEVVFVIMDKGTGNEYCSVSANSDPSLTIDIKDCFLYVVQEPKRDGISIVISVVDVVCCHPAV
jgi:hypothetical protein